MKIKQNSVSNIRQENHSDKENKSKKIRMLLMNGLESNKSFFPTINKIYNKKLNTVSSIKFNKNIPKDTDRDLSRKNRVSFAKEKTNKIYNNSTIYKESKKPLLFESPQSHSSMNRTLYSKFGSKLLDTSSQITCNFNNKLIQNYITTQSTLLKEDNNCLKVEKVIAKESNNECKEVNQCDTLKVTKGNIVFHLFKKKDKFEEANKLLLSYLKKKGSTATVSATTFRIKKVNFKNCIDLNTNTDCLDEINNYNISQCSSKLDKKKSERKLLDNDLKQTVTIFSKI